MTKAVATALLSAISLIAKAEDTTTETDVTGGLVLFVAFLGGAVWIVIWAVKQYKQMGFI